MDCAKHKKARNQAKQCNKTEKSTRNPYLNYLKKYRKENRGLKATEVIQKGAQEWRKLTSTLKLPYVKEAFYAPRRYHRRRRPVAACSNQYAGKRMQTVARGCRKKNQCMSLRNKRMLKPCAPRKMSKKACEQKAPNNKRYSIKKLARQCGGHGKKKLAKRRGKKRLNKRCSKVKAEKIKKACVFHPRFPYRGKKTKL